MLFYDVAYIYLFLVPTNCPLETMSRALLRVFNVAVVSTDITWLVFRTGC